MNYIQESIEEFSLKTKYNLSSFFRRYVDFFDTDRLFIEEFFSGNQAFPESSFQDLEYLIEESLIIENIFQNFDFNSTIFHDLYEYFVQIKRNLETYNKASKWLRSSVSLENYRSGRTINHNLNQEETLIDVSKNQQKNIDPVNNWTDIALLNDLEEENYTREGNVLLKIELLSDIQNVNLTSLVDNINSETIYGKDVLQNITYKNNDLAIVERENCLLQSCEILLSLRKGDNPQFPDSGISGGIGVSKNTFGLLFPTIFRQISDLFATDETFKSISLINLVFKNNFVDAQFEVETIVGERRNLTSIL